MSTMQMTTARIVALSVLGVMAMATVLVLNWPQPSVAAPKAVVVEKPVTPEGCSRFVRTSDAFVEVTNTFLATQNEALDAVISQDSAALDEAITSMGKVKDRYDGVLDRYADARAGCL